MGERKKVAHQAAKSGLVWLTRHAASLAGRQGAHCNLLSPGVTLTASALATTTEERRYEALASIRSPRLGKSEDMAAMVAFLFSDDDAFINCRSFLVDGGAHLSREPGPVTRCQLAGFRFVPLSVATSRFHAVATPAGGGSWEPMPKMEKIRYETSRYKRSVHQVHRDFCRPVPVRLCRDGLRGRRCAAGGGRLPSGGRRWGPQ